MVQQLHTCLNRIEKVTLPQQPENLTLLLQYRTKWEIEIGNWKVQILNPKAATGDQPPYVQVHMAIIYLSLMRTSKGSVEH